MAARPPSESEDTALSLTMAVVAGSAGPLLLLNGDLDIVAASKSFGETFEVDHAAAPGRSYASLSAGEWNTPQLRSLLTAAASSAAVIEAYEMDLKRPGRATRRLVIHAQKLVYEDLENHRLLVAVSDVTDARADAKAREDALRQNVVLLREVRHRVANSLQIIASVLLQNARKAQSDETRGHLTDAHNRVMSVAALERQLSGSSEGDVDLHAYFTQLCNSIAASMIGDSDQLSLAVTGAAGTVDARVSVSLGLIVTELVISALKHAFPDGRRGHIAVDCAFRGPDWTLSVIDDGVGMPADPTQIHAGLGASIVEALARQLQAVVVTEPAHPGTRVSVTRDRNALLDEGDESTNELAAPRPAAQSGGNQ